MSGRDEFPGKEKEKERRIVWVTTKTWARFYGWYQSLRCSLVMLTLLANSRHASSSDPSTVFSSNELLNLLLRTALDLTMAIGLLRGSYKRSVQLLRVWMLVTFLSAFIFPTCALVDWLFAESSDKFFYELFASMFALPMDIFLIWVVGVHQREIGAAIGIVCYEGFKSNKE